MARTYAMPFQVGWDILHQCNLRCSHCYFDAAQLSDKRQISAADALEFVEYLGTAGVFHLSIAGGEPLLFPSIVEVVQRASVSGMLVAISTNALLLTPELARDLRSAGLNTMQISIDGSTAGLNDLVRGKGSFEKTVRGVKVAVAAGIPVTIACVILRPNSDDIENIIELAYSLGARAVKVQTLIDRGLGEVNADFLRLPDDDLVRCIERLWMYKAEHAPPLDLMLPLVPSVMEAAKRAKEPYYRGSGCLGCQPGLKTIRVDNVGDVRACGAANGEAETVGNILEVPLGEIWRESQQIAEWRNRAAVLSGESPTACGSICGKGCRSVPARS